MRLQVCAKSINAHGKILKNLKQFAFDGPIVGSPIMGSYGYGGNFQPVFLQNRQMFQLKNIAEILTIFENKCYSPSV